LRPTKIDPLLTKPILFIQLKFRNHMKNLARISLSLCLLLAMTLTGCFKDNCNREVTYIQPQPIYKTLDEIRVDVNVEAEKEMENPGKIYVYGQYIFVNELHKGIHVINNTDPQSPVKESFIAIEGNVDMAIKDGVLYADNYVDLLALDINDPKNATVLKRIENAFPHDGETNEGLLVAYEGKTVTEKVDCDWNPDPSWRLLSDSSDPSFSGAETASTDKNYGTNGTGLAGSMARFAAIGDMLYIIDDEEMYLFDITGASNPTSTGTVNIGRGIETIYPYKSNLFIGANDGMYIYDNTDPQNPTYTSKFDHFTACDPVVVDDNYAYVTLRSDNACGSGWRDEIQVVDISDLNNPFLATNHIMEEPKGLAVDNGVVYLCDGHAGLKVLDNLEEWDITLLDEVTTIDAYDVILVPNTNTVVIVGENGLFQYDRTNPVNLEFLSQITLK